jgi:2-dehydropantoate 2-reductase
VWVGATQVQPGVIKQIKAENTELGLFPSPDVAPELEQSRLNEFVQLLKNGGTHYSVEDNIQIKRWEKVVWNTAWNPLTALTLVDTQRWLNSSPEAERMTRRLMHEVVEVAQRCGVPLKFELVDTLIDRIQALQGIYSSMYKDVKDGNALEVEVIVGTPMRKAREFQMDVPTLSAVYSLIIAVDQRLREPSRI